MLYSLTLLIAVVPLKSEQIELKILTNRIKEQKGINKMNSITIHGMILFIIVNIFAYNFVFIAKKIIITSRNNTITKFTIVIIFLQKSSNANRLYY
jgi:hypothetical protein